MKLRTTTTEQAELFRPHLDQILNPRKPLYLVANQIARHFFEEPIDPTTLTEWRHRIGPAGMEKRLHGTLERTKS